jgi:hypothetical protein
MARSTTIGAQTSTLVMTVASSRDSFTLLDVMARSARCVTDRFFLATVYMTKKMEREMKM